MTMESHLIQHLYLAPERDPEFRLIAFDACFPVSPSSKKSSMEVESYRASDLDDEVAVEEIMFVFPGANSSISLLHSTSKP